MNFGVCSFPWARPFVTAELGVLGRIAAAGLDVVEIAVEEPGQLDLGELRDALEAHSLAASVVCWGVPGRDLSSGDPFERDEGLRYLRYCVDVAEAVQASVVAGPFHSAVGRTPHLSPGEVAAARARAVTSLHALGSYAGERGVCLALEPVNRYESSLLNTAEQGVDLCDRIGLGNVGLLLDTFHMIVEEKHLGGAIRCAADRLFIFMPAKRSRRPGPWSYRLA